MVLPPVARAGNSQAGGLGKQMVRASADPKHVGNFRVMREKHAGTRRKRASSGGGLCRLSSDLIQLADKKHQRGQILCGDWSTSTLLKFQICRALEHSEYRPPREAGKAGRSSLSCPAPAGS